MREPVLLVRNELSEIDDIELGASRITETVEQIRLKSKLFGLDEPDMKQLNDSVGCWCTDLLLKHGFNTLLEVDELLAGKRIDESVHNNYDVTDKLNVSTYIIKGVEAVTSAKCVVELDNRDCVARTRGSIIDKDIRKYTIYMLMYLDSIGEIHYESWITDEESILTKRDFGKTCVRINIVQIGSTLKHVMKDVTGVKQLSCLFPMAVKDVNNLTVMDNCIDITGLELDSVPNNLNIQCGESALTRVALSFGGLDDDNNKYVDTNDLAKRMLEMYRIDFSGAYRLETISCDYIGMGSCIPYKRKIMGMHQYLKSLNPDKLIVIQSQLRYGVEFGVRSIEDVQGNTVFDDSVVVLSHTLALQLYLSMIEVGEIKAELARTGLSGRELDALEEYDVRQSDMTLHGLVATLSDVLDNSGNVIKHTEKFSLGATTKCANSARLVASIKKEQLSSSSEYNGDYMTFEINTNTRYIEVECAGGCNKYNIFDVWTLDSAGLGMVDTNILTARKVIYSGNEILKHKASINYIMGMGRISCVVTNNNSLECLQLGLCDKTIGNDFVAVRNLSKLRVLWINYFGSELGGADTWILNCNNLEEIVITSLDGDVKLSEFLDKLGIDKLNKLKNIAVPKEFAGQLQELYNNKLRPAKAIEIGHKHCIMYKLPRG